MARDRATGPILLATIALFYPVFAIEHGTGPEIVLHVGVALAFLAVAGHARGHEHEAAAMIAHGAFDLAAHALSDGLAPRWWGPFRLGVDVVLDAWLLAARPWRAAG